MRGLSKGPMAIVAVIFALPLTVHAAFMGPSQSPPQGNVPGVVWNRATVGGSANQQAGTEINISGSARLGGDAILGDGKALRIDKIGTANLYIGNWGNGVQGLTVTVNGDVEVVPADVSEGKVTAPKFCLGSDCITQWPAPIGGGITSVTAGTGISGGGNAGDVPIAFDETYGDARYVNIIGDNMQGALQVPNPPINPLDAVPKAYVDDTATLKVDKAGDTMTGELLLNANPSQALGAATKQYVDDAGAAKLDKTGDSMTGELVLNGNPTQPLGAAPRQYVEGLVAPINAALFNYVLKAGDSMSGVLTATKGVKVTGVDPSSGVGLVISLAANTGISATAPTAINAAGTNYSYYSTGNPIFGIAIPAAADTGGFFKGTVKGLDAESPGTAGYFVNLTTPTIYANLANTTYAGAFYSPVGSTSLYAQRNVLVGGDITAAANVLSSCVWTAYIADGVAIQCAAATPIMSGVQRSGGTERIYCCAL